MSNSRSAAGAAGGGSAGTLASRPLRPATVWQIRKQQRQYWRLMRATPQSSAAEAASRSGSSLTVEEQDRLCEASGPTQGRRHALPPTQSFRALWSYFWGAAGQGADP